MEWLNFRHLHAFWAVCRSGSFSKAAERIYISQSTVSEHVAALEEYFDEPLIERNTRSLSVTKRGEALMAYADEIFGRRHQPRLSRQARIDARAPPARRHGRRDFT